MSYKTPEITLNQISESRVSSDQDQHRKFTEGKFSTMAQNYQSNPFPERIQEQTNDDTFEKSSVIILYVVKMFNYSKRQTLNNQDDTKRNNRLEHFKMEIDCSKCLENGDDSDLRKFRRKVISKLKVSDNFKIYNSHGITIQESDLYFLNQEKQNYAIVYVSPQNDYFDYDTYIKMFKNVKKLGEGGFGLVQLGRHIVTNEEFAIKFIMPHTAKADEAGNAFKEAQMLQNLNHPNIVKLYNVFQLSDTKIVLFMQHIEGGTLKDYVQSLNGKLSESEAQKILLQVGNAINYCHQRDIVHRDIKMENILLLEKGNIDKGIKVIDFGIAGMVQFQLEQHKAGTLRYCPPELLSGSSYKAQPSFDVWSMGVLLYRMLYGVFPFDAESWKDTKATIIKANLKFPEDNDEVSDTCKALIRLMLNKNPEKRPKLFQLIRHPWFTSFRSSLNLMNSTMFPQNTMMNFFKQELKQVVNQKSQVPDDGFVSPSESRLENRTKPYKKQLYQSEKVKKSQPRPVASYARDAVLRKYKSPYAIPILDTLGRVDKPSIPKQVLVEVKKSLDMKKQKLSELRSFKPKLQLDDKPRQWEQYRTIDRYEKSKSQIKPLDLTLKKEMQSISPLNALPLLGEKRCESEIHGFKDQLSATSRNKLNRAQFSKIPSVQSFRSLQVANQLISPSSEAQVTTRGNELPVISQERHIKGGIIPFQPKKRTSDISQEPKMTLNKKRISIMTGTGTTSASVIAEDTPQYIERYNTTTKNKASKDTNMQLINDLNQKLVQMNNQVRETQQMINEHKKDKRLGQSITKRRTDNASLYQAEPLILINHNHTALNNY